MKWQEDSNLARRMLDDLGKEIWIDKKLPHLTELIYCLTRSWCQRVQPLPYTPQETALFVCGVGLERVLLRPHRQHLEGECEGIHFDADFLDYDSNVGELKTTRQSMKNLPDGMSQAWEIQVKGYMYALGKDAATLAVMCLMGNYAPPFPQLGCWHGTAPEQELANTWQWLQWRKDILLGHLERKVMPKQFTYNFSWECQYCAYKLLCDAKRSVEEVLT
jgi:CRISPR/Cas system-associated exonuclease Cas4 (RecB family)